MNTALRSVAQGESICNNNLTEIIPTGKCSFPKQTVYFLTGGKKIPKDVCCVLNITFWMLVKLISWLMVLLYGAVGSLVRGNPLGCDFPLVISLLHSSSLHFQYAVQKTSLCSTKHSGDCTLLICCSGQSRSLYRQYKLLFTYRYWHLRCVHLYF